MTPSKVVFVKLMVLIVVSSPSRRAIRTPL
jgi:hypothetical protein